MYLKILLEIKFGDILKIKGPEFNNIREILLELNLYLSFGFKVWLAFKTSWNEQFLERLLLSKQDRKYAKTLTIYLQRFE